MRSSGNNKQKETKNCSKIRIGYWDIRLSIFQYGCYNPLQIK